MEQVGEGVYVETGYEGVNVGAIVIDDGVVCVDAPSLPRDARHWATQLDHLHGRSGRYLVLSDFQPERVMNARWLSVPIIAQQWTADRLSALERRTPIPAMESPMVRNAAEPRDVPVGGLERPSVTFSQAMVIASTQRCVQLMHMPGPTPGSVWAYVPEAGVLFVGDSVVSETPPMLADLCLAKWLDGLERLDAGEWAVTTVVPGRGSLGNPTAVTDMILFLRQLLERLAGFVDAGEPRDRVADLLPDLLGHYSTSSRDWPQRQLRPGLERAYDEIVGSRR